MRTLWPASCSIQCILPSFAEVSFPGAVPREADFVLGSGDSTAQRPAPDANPQHHVIKQYYRHIRQPPALTKSPAQRAGQGLRRLRARAGQGLTPRRNRPSGSPPRCKDLYRPSPAPALRSASGEKAPCRDARRSAAGNAATRPGAASRIQELTGMSQVCACKWNRNRLSRKGSGTSTCVDRKFFSRNSACRTPRSTATPRPRWTS